MDNLTGKVALVTGGGRGIGRAISIRLAKAGCDVAVNYVSRKDDAESAAAEIRKLGRRAIVVHADASKSADVTRMVGEVEKHLGAIDILVNNAGKIHIQPVIEQLREEHLNDMISANLLSCFLVTQAVLPGMRGRNWGRVINLTSIAGQMGSPIGPLYGAAKAAVIGLTKSYARIVAKDGVTVNAIAPALIATEMVTANPMIRPDMVPVGRLGDVEETADVAVMLAGNGYITGQTIGVNGGMYLG
jgi:3-oxoacyl-[acyl-carrier protein] reductase